MSHVMLAKELQKGITLNTDLGLNTPPEGWIWSEKYDGYRALFQYKDGRGIFMSRSGKEFGPAPQWFIDAMPPPKLLKDTILDGELWAGRDNFELMGVVRRNEPNDEDYIDIQFVVYDIVNGKDTFIERLKDLRKIVSFAENKWNVSKKTLPSPYKNLDCPIQYAEQNKVTSVKLMEEKYKEILEGGGEGIMIKHPLCPYEKKRSSFLFKIKPTFEREAIITGYSEGKGKYKGMLGGFECQPLLNFDTYMVIDSDKGHAFTLSGMDDDVRKNYKKTHPLNTIISFECSGYTGKGIPRFPRYVRKRTDIIIKEIQGDIHLNKVREIFKALEDDCKIRKDIFPLRVYQKVNQVLTKFTNDNDLLDMSDIPGVGKGVKDKIRDIMATGTCPAYEKIRGLSEERRKEFEAKRIFMGIHGVGPMQAKKLANVGFRNIQDLRNLSLEELGKHLNEVQMNGLQYYEDMQERIPYKEIEKHEKYVKMILKKIDKDAELTIAGSYRRKKETSGDIDILVKCSKRNIYTDFIDSLEKSGYLVATFAKGTKKYMGMGKISKGMTSRRIDIMYTKPEEYPFAVLYFTGSSEFNQRMRAEVLAGGLSLNEYSLKDVDTKKKVDHIFNNEKDIFEYLDYEYLEPENRIN